ncbi:MAG: 3'-5' exonuclease [Candidatus Heteroscillospira sp.]|jgi:DNA polymerase-3 subunit epsilon
MERFVAFDVETPNGRNDRMCALGLSVLENRSIVHEEYYLIDPECHFDYGNIRIHGITPEMVLRSPRFDEVWRNIAPIMRSGILAVHNAQFDMGVLRKCLRAYGFEEEPFDCLCTVRMSRAELKDAPNHRLNTLCDYYGIDLDHHNAASDASACAQILRNLLDSGAKAEKYVRRYEML